MKVSLAMKITLDTAVRTALFLIFLMTGMGQALAQTSSSDHLFTIYDVEIDERARTAIEARRIGLERAEEIAFQALIERLIRPEDLSRFQMPFDATASDYVLGIEVGEERNSRVRYIGKVNVSFDAFKIEELLSSQNIPFVGFTPGDAFVFPMYWVEGEYTLWDDKNLLFKAWEEVQNQNGIIRYQLPERTINERISLSPVQVLAGRQPDQILLVLNRYGQESYLAITARFFKSTSDEVEYLEFAVGQPLEGFPPTTKRVYPQVDETEEDMLKRAIVEFYTERDRDWKEQALTQFGETRQMALMVPIESPKIWAEIKRRLESITVINKVIVARLGLPDTYIAIDFSGTNEQLSLALRQKGLILLQAGQGFALVRQEDARKYLAGRGGP